MTPDRPERPERPEKPDARGTRYPREGRRADDLPTHELAVSVQRVSSIVIKLVATAAAIGLLLTYVGWRRVDYGVDIAAVRAEVVQNRIEAATRDSANDRRTVRLERILTTMMLRDCIEARQNAPAAVAECRDELETAVRSPWPTP